MDTESLTPETTPSPEERSAFEKAVERDAWIIRLAQIGPIWIDVLIRIGLFRTRQVAERRLKTLERNGLLPCVGRVSLSKRRGTRMWCLRRFRPQLLRHEVDVMRVYFAYWPYAYGLTGEDVDPRWKADLELTIGDPVSGRRYMIEVDEGTEPLWQVRRRLDGYSDCPYPVLMTTTTSSRAYEIEHRISHPRVFVSTLARGISEPWGRHWRNCLGELENIS